jgi:hypothetical protein
MSVVPPAAARWRAAHPVRWILARLIGGASIAFAALVLDIGTAHAASCGGSAPVASRPGTVIVADGFESGSVRTHWSVTDEGDAWAGITTSAPHRGMCAGRIVVTSSSTSRANLRRGLPAVTTNVWAVGWFRVEREGSRGSNVPTFRFFNGSNRVLDVFRANGTGAMWLRTASGTGSWRYTWLNAQLPLHRWAKIEVHVRANSSQSTVSVWIDGVRRFESSSYSLPASRLTMVMIGAEHVKQVEDLWVDDVVVTRI